MPRRSPLIAVWSLLACTLLTAVAEAAPGDLDPTFGVGGLATAAVAGASAGAQAVARQSDGRIVVAGIADVVGQPGAGLVVLARFAADGTHDPTFADGGPISVPSRAWAAALAIQEDDRILLAGTDFELGLMRFLPDGAPDADFGDGGRVPASTLGMRVAAIALQPDGKIVVAGAHRLDLGDWEIDLLAVARLHPDGRLDETFGVGGRVTTDIQGGLQDDSWAEAVLLQPDGRIVAAGGCGLGFALVRYDEDGVLDAGFGGDGIVTTPDTGSASAVVLTDEDGLVAFGSPYDPAGAFMVGYRADGSLDPAFANGGRVGAALPDGTRIWSASHLVRQPDGKLVGAATAASGKVLLRFAADGSLDCRFGGGGIAATGLGEGIRFVQHFGVVLDDDGRLVTAGAVGPVGARTLALERREGGDGAPRCGDCSVDPGEACDDGNASATDACKPDCTPNVCGDGAVHAGVEACDDGAGNDGPASCCTAACTPKPDETSCDDGLVCTVDDRCRAGACDGAPRPCPACEACDASAGGCVATPRTSCRQSLAPRHSSLALRPGGTGPDRLAWRWMRGQATFTPDFGDPTATDTYAFCLYGVSGPGSQLLVRATAPAGGTCGAHPCWRRSQSGRLVYRDRTGAADGLTGVTLQWGDDRRSSVTVQQSGRSLLPALPVAAPLVAQLQASSGRCWETRHGPDAIRRNDAALFRAVGD